MSSNKEIKIGSILSYVQMFLSVIIALTYSRFMISKLGRSEYGLYHTVTSTISMLSILNLGFNASYVRFYAKYKKNKDFDNIYRLNGMFLIVFTFIGLIALLCGIFLIFNLNLVFDTGLTAEEYDLARKLMILLIINLSLSFPMSVFSTIISSNEKFIFLKLLGMIKTVLGPLVNIPLLLMGFRSVGLVVSALIFAILTDIVYIYYVLFKLHNKFYFSNYEKGLFSSLFSFSFFIAVNLIVDQINNGIDRVLLARFKGTVSVAIYSIGATLYVYYMQISTSISSVFTPRIHKIYNSIDNLDQRNKSLSDLFIKVGRIQFLILLLAVSGICVFGDSFIYFWVGNGYSDSYYVLILLVVPATVPLIQNIGIEIQRAANKHKFRSIAYLVMAVCNLIVSIFLCQLYGAIGAAIGTAISLVLANGIIMNIYYFKCLGIDIPRFWNNILKMGIGIIPALIIGSLIKIFIPITSVLFLVLYALLYTIVFSCCAWFLAMNSDEKNLFITPINKILHARKK